MKEPLATFIAILIMALVMIIVFGPLIRFAAINQNLSTDDICKLEFGSDWAYEYNRNVGTTCIELDYITLQPINRTEYDFDVLEMIDKHCNSPPRFFELKRWDDGCDALVSGDEQ